MTTPYREFLESKAKLADTSGFVVDPTALSDVLKPHQRDTVLWALAGGRRAIFASFGLGKTMMQLEIVRLALRHMYIERVVTDPDACPRGLIVMPLGVRQEFMRDAALLGRPLGATSTYRGPVADPRLDLRFIRSGAEIEDGVSRIYLTNYESVRDGKLDPRTFDVVSLDEAAILRGFGGSKTFRELMRMYEGSAAYRFVATATPSPNEYIELLSYAAFLDVMDVGQAKTRFFKRDSTKADALTLHPHMEEEFWLWVASWAMFLQKPSDLGHCDEGYELPPIDVRWHEIETPARFDADRSGRGSLFSKGGLGVQQAAAEKRESLPLRVDKVRELVAEDPDEHFVIWHDLEAERHALQEALPDAVSVWGSQDLDERERRIIGFSDGDVQILATKPVIAGSGTNFQRHCHRAIFAGIGFKFADFIQAIHRIHRFLQTKAVRIDLIYTSAERDVRAVLERKWEQHKVLVAQMGELIAKHGLSHEAMAGALQRAIGVERREVEGEGYRLVNADAVEETARMDEASTDLIVTSIPFSTQYEYTPSYNDFGHSESNEAFWRQMDFLTPELLRVLAPGRVAVVHVKDRIVPSGMTGLGFQTVYPFHADAIAHYTRHGFAFLGMKTVVTDVVRENNQTYRLGWSEQCKDGSRMGAGMPEYLLLFRKAPTDRSNGYADTPVVKEKAEYSRSRWQIDAHGYMRSAGDRLLSSDELADLPHEKIFKLFRAHSLDEVYDHEQHVALGEALEGRGRLPVTFMLLQPASWHEDVWADVARMRTLNMLQERKGQQQHLCPLQFDIVERLIRQFSMEGETVFDPFGGLMTVPYCAVKMGRRGVGIELNASYFADGVAYVEGAAREASVPTLFDLAEVGA